MTLQRLRRLGRAREGDDVLPGEVVEEVARRHGDFALVGALWLLALVALAYLQLDDVVPLPRVEGFPLPTLMLIGGLLAGLLLALLARPLVRAGARRRRRRASARLTTAVEQVAQEEVLEPLRSAREDHDRFCAAADRAAA